MKRIKSEQKQYVVVFRSSQRELRSSRPNTCNTCRRRRTFVRRRSSRWPIIIEEKSKRSIETRRTCWKNTRRKKKVALFTPTLVLTLLSVARITFPVDEERTILGADQTRTRRNGRIQSESIVRRSDQHCLSERFLDDPRTAKHRHQALTRRDLSCSRRTCSRDLPDEIDVPARDPISTGGWRRQSARDSQASRSSRRQASLDFWLPRVV